MIQITCEHNLAIAHRLYNYTGQCERLHGHNYRITLTLMADSLNVLGMTLDFTIVKKVLFQALDQIWDHRTLLFEQDPLCTQLLQLLDDGSVWPAQFNPTAENMALYLGEQFFPHVLHQANLPESVSVVSVRVHETEHNSACWSVE